MVGVQPFSHINGTAFTRPIPSAHRDQTLLNIPEDTLRHALPQGGVNASPLKHYPQINNSFDRASYMPSVGLGSYPEYTGSSNSYSTPRMQNFCDTHAQNFTSVPFSNGGINMAPGTTNYWSEGRSHATFPDPYSPYGYNKYAGSYDSYGRGPTYLRTSSYQDLGRSAFEASRSLYGRPENIAGK